MVGANNAHHHRPGVFPIPPTGSTIHERREDSLTGRRQEKISDSEQTIAKMNRIRINISPKTNSIGNPEREIRASKVERERKLKLRKTICHKGTSKSICVHFKHRVFIP